MFCDKCGKPLNQDALFCSYCGSKVTKKDVAPKAENTNSNFSDKVFDVVGKVFYIILCVLLMCLAKVIGREMFHDITVPRYMEYALPGAFAGVVCGIVCCAILDKYNHETKCFYASFALCLFTGVLGGIFFAVGTAAMTMIIAKLKSRA